MSPTRKKRREDKRKRRKRERDSSGSCTCVAKRFAKGYATLWLLCYLPVWTTLNRELKERELGVTLGRHSQASLGLLAQPKERDFHLFSTWHRLRAERRWLSQLGRVSALTLSRSRRLASSFPGPRGLCVDTCES